MTTPSDPGSLDSAVSNVMTGTALGSAINRPINDILSDMGLPSLPELPPAPVFPDLPALPTLDLSVLTRPLTDMASAFGSGELTKNVDATKVLEGVQSALSTVLQMASTLMSLASSWEGSGASGAGEKSAAAETNAGQLGVQNVEQKTVLTGAATTVATGAATMAGIITKFVTGVTISAPFLVTPPGQAFLLSLATETAAEATAVTAQTRVALTGHSAQMTAAGQKVNVTSAPTSGDSLSQVTQLLSLISPLSSVASSGVSAVQQLQTIANPTTTTTDDTTEITPLSETVDTSGGGTGGIPINTLSASTQLSQLGTRTMSAPPGSGTPTADPVPAARGATSAPGGMVPPMGAGAGLGHRAGEADDSGEVRTNLVTGEHGDEVVGELGNTGVPVVGAVGNQAPRTTQ
ncbi:hypothetical protein AB0N05_21810 [Nocardia sp. NPDC051030]|uniref:hypothetical protein n=1 Tax=Nocardia sp. NPDC051030 TaxID=3155162 RepID=UPI0034238648